jgi:hypothetical protein
MAIHLETLEAVIATALNIVKSRPLADLYPPALAAIVTPEIRSPPGVEDLEALND